MPTILAETEVKLERADLDKRVSLPRKVGRDGYIIQPSRGKGVHVSEILRYIGVTIGNKKVVEDIDEETFPLRMALGFAWEEFAVSLYPEICWQPGEKLVDGVYMNADGIMEVTTNISTDMCIEEFKFTAKKAKDAATLLKDETYWKWQLLSYCHGYNAVFARLHVCYYNGDYRGSGPIYMRYLFGFDDKEIETNWRMVTNNKLMGV